MIGHIVEIRIDNYHENTFLYVDEKKQVRGINDKSGLIYFTEEERWGTDTFSLGTLEGKLEKGNYVSVLKDGKIIDRNNYPLTGKVENIQEVDIEEEIKKDSGVVGITRHAYRPGALN